MIEDFVENGMYRHFKGGIYELKCIAKNSETLEEMVVYSDISDDEKIWVRPASMWSEEVSFNGKTLQCFECIAPDIDKFDKERHFKVIEEIMQIFCEYDRFGDNNPLSYYDKITDEVITVPLGAFAVAEGDCEETEIEEYEREFISKALSICKEKDRYTQIPADGLLDDFQIMEDFVYIVPWSLQSQLEKTLHGKGVFRRFKDMVRTLGLIDDWYSYKDMRNRREIRQWCDFVGIDWKKSYFK